MLPPLRLRQRFTLAQRTTPEHVTRYQPVDPATFQLPLTVRLPARLLGPLSGDALRQVIVTASDTNQVVGAAIYSVRSLSLCTTKLDTSCGNQLYERKHDPF